MKIVAHIENEDVKLNDDGTITYTSKAAVDTDGSGPLHGDPDAQKNTSLHLDGKPLNADEDHYIVIPPSVQACTDKILLGCQAWVCNKKTGACTAAVVGDIGPRKKLGEISVACAKALGINASPTSGGEDAHVIEYTITPGTPAEVNGKVYKLQPA